MVGVGSCIIVVGHVSFSSLVCAATFPIESSWSAWGNLLPPPEFQAAGEGMPGNRKTKSECVAFLEARVRQYEAATATMCSAATFKPILPRGGEHDKWDWNCNMCGHLVYAKRHTCFRYNCDGRCREGATVVGSVRGQYCGSSVDADIRQQIAAANAPST